MDHPSHHDQIKRLNRIMGQLEGVRRMIEAGEYCPKILMQTKAITSALGSLETNILESHIECCVQAAMKKGGSDAAVKTKELVELFKTRLK